QLAERVAGAVDALAQGDAGEFVAAGGTAGGAGAVLAVEVGRRLGLRDGVGAWIEVGEAVGAGGVGGGRPADRAAQEVGAGQGHGHAAGPALAGVLGAVVVGVGEDGTRQPRRR